VFAALFAADALLVLGLWGDAFGLPGPAAGILLAVGLAGGLLVIGIGMDPLRRWELRFATRAEPETVRWYQVALFVLSPLVLCIPLWHYLTGEPWRLSIARAVALAVYLGLFAALGRLQRLGVPPYWRPAWYGFFLAGITASLVWSVAAGQDVTEGLATGISGPLLHYFYVRWATRDALRFAAERDSEQRPVGFTGEPDGSLTVSEPVDGRPPSGPSPPAPG
jgi:hypothetical protein